MQQKIVFKSKGLNCSGLFYLPDYYSATEGKQCLRSLWRTV